MAGASRPRSGIDASLLARTHLLELQRENGGWEGEVEWCPMITAQYVLVREIVEMPLDAGARDGIRRYFRAQASPEGTWGLHRESGPSLYVTTLVYLAMRVAGAPPDDPLAARARAWIGAQPGGVGALPSWGRFWLALLGLVPFESLDPLPPEAFLLPRALPFHPARLYCHTRRIYLAMAFLSGGRVAGRLGSLGDDLALELSTGAAARPGGVVSATDLHARRTGFSRALSGLLRILEILPVPPLRRAARARCFDRILDEQRDSRHQGLSPVNGLLNCVALWSERAGGHPDLARSIAGIESWRWDDAEEGIRFAGARSETWDTAFALRALLESSDPASAGAAGAAYRRLDRMQVLDEVSLGEASDRDAARGGWCFSDGTHRWPVADCTAEALSAVIAAERVPGLIAPADRIPVARLRLGIEFLLDRQNGDGGFATYERRRGPDWLEALNPSEMFSGCMIERSYVECTASATEALALFSRHHPDEIPRVRVALSRAATALRDCQRSDGSFAPSWGIGFLYAGWFAIRGFLASGLSPEDPAVARAARWILGRQKPDGGWGEHFTSCSTGQYVEHPESQAVMTSWALLALMDVLPPGSEPVERGVQWLAERQRDGGDFPPEAVNGVFFGTAMLDYRLYRSYFPAWALARYARLAAEGAEGSVRKP